MKTETPTIQETILQQIKAIDIWALGSWAARDLKASGTSLFFRVNGTKLKYGWIEIDLNEGLDLYTVRAIQTRKGAIKNKGEISQVYAEDLVNVIDSFVG